MFGEDQLLRAGRWACRGGSIAGPHVDLVAEGLAAIEAAEVVGEDCVDAVEHGVGPVGVVGGEHHVWQRPQGGIRRQRLGRGDNLVSAIYRTYEQLPEQIQAEIPLERILRLVGDDGAG